MNKICLSNESDFPLLVMIEPNAEYFEIPPKKQGNLSGDIGTEVLQIDYNKDDCISIWITGEVEVTVGDRVYKFAA